MQFACPATRTEETKLDRNAMVRRTPTQSTMRRTICAARQAGIDIARIEVDSDGRIVIVTGKPEPTKAADLDNWIEKHARAA